MTGNEGTTLLVVGDTLHAFDQDGRLCTHAALARQLDQWFAEFDHVQIAGVLVQAGVPTGFEPYRYAPIEFFPLRSAGGVGVRGKLDALRASASWIRSLVPLLRQADVVHLRAPCNVTLVAIPLARLQSRRRYAMYAGAWDPPPGGPLSYRAQRWMLRHFGGVVHVYAPRSAELPSNIWPNFSPSYTSARLKELAGPTERRMERIRSNPPGENVLRIACVGRFSTNKNQEQVVRAVARLNATGVPVELRFAGSGTTEPAIRELVTALDLDGHVTFLGQCDEVALVELFEWADVNVAPTFVEGYGRVLLEGMGVGCPAVCGPGAIQQEMVSGGRGAQVDPGDPDDLARELLRLRSEPVAFWLDSAIACRQYASMTTMEDFAASVRRVLESL